MKSITLAAGFGLGLTLAFADRGNSRDTTNMTLQLASYWPRKPTGYRKDRIPQA